MSRTNHNPKIALINRVLNFVLARGWTNYDSFSFNLARRIARSKSRSIGQVIKTIEEQKEKQANKNG